MNEILREDINQFVSSFPFADQLEKSSFLITGATGLIGSTIVRCLMALDKTIVITCPVRSVAKARGIFKEDSARINFIECDLIEYTSNLSFDDKFQYIIHCACPTSGKYMVEHPVETIEFTLSTTQALLKYLTTNPLCAMLYLSSVEYYGQIDSEDLITESAQGYIDNTDPRSSYPLSKRLAEYLCNSYANEYNINVKSARLSQTFGAGVSREDNRVFAQFAKSILSGSDIVLHTDGTSSKPYCYSIDAVRAILYILLLGSKGESYNVANPETYISIRSMAEFVRDSFNPSINVVVNINNEMGYAPKTKLNLSVEKLINLGWKPSYDLYSMFDRLIKSFYFDDV